MKEREENTLLYFMKMSLPALLPSSQCVGLQGEALMLGTAI